MIQICLNKKCSYTDVNRIFSVRSVQFFWRIRLQNGFSCRNRSVFGAVTDPNAIFYHRTVVLGLILRLQMECFTTES